MLHLDLKSPNVLLNSKFQAPARPRETGVWGKHTYPEEKTLVTIGMTNTKSGAGDKFLLLD